jgi:uncharacterized protein (DUF362 family)
LGAVAAALLPRTLFGQGSGSAIGQTSEVASSAVIGVAHGDRAKLVKAAIDLLGGIGEFVKDGDRVCIKPNLSFAANVECGATTSSCVIKQLVELCLGAGAKKVIILDHTIADPQLCIEKSGVMEAVVDPKKVSLVMLDQERQYAEVAVPGGQELTAIKVAKAALGCDRLISLPTAKSHSATGVSLGIKNLMGLIWDRGALHHRNLHRAIAELAIVIKADLTGIDATRVLTSGGPGGPGKTVVLDTVIAGTDVVAVDSHAVGITSWYDRSFAGKSVKHIVAAHELGLGEIDSARVDVKTVEV